MSTILTERHGPVDLITIDRPERLNALDETTRRELLAALERAFRDPGVGAVVLTGAGRAFCTGQDVTAGAELADAGGTVMHTYNPIVTAIRGADTPLVTAVNGAAVGAGLGLAVGGDAAVMARSAYLSCAFSRVALVPDTGTTTILLRHLGHVAAYEAMTTARRIDADEALALRLVNEVCADDEVVDRALQRARQLAAGPRLAFGLTKRLLVAAARGHEQDVLELEARFQGRAAATVEHRDAVTAFVARTAKQR